MIDQMLPIEAFLDENAQNPIRIYLNQLLLHVNTANEKALVSEQRLAKELSDHARSKMLLSDLSLQLEESRKFSSDPRYSLFESFKLTGRDHLIRYDPFSVLSVNNSLQRALTDCKLELEGVAQQNAVLRLELLRVQEAKILLEQDSRVRSGAQRIRELETEKQDLAELLMRSQEELAQSNGNLAEKQKLLKAAYMREKEWISLIDAEKTYSESLDTPNSQTCENCKKLIHIQESVAQGHSVELQNLNSELTRMTKSNLFYKSTHLNAIKQLNNERDQLFAA
ncbi:hypothetical protein HK096_001003, partial [Nowakowskiella sp. JEL0078]